MSGGELLHTIDHSFENQLQLEVLATAEAAIPRLPEGRRKAVSAAILSDRQWVLDQ